MVVLAAGTRELELLAFAFGAWRAVADEYGDHRRVEGKLQSGEVDEEP